MQWLKVRSLQGEQNVGKPKACAPGYMTPPLAGLADFGCRA